MGNAQAFQQPEQPPIDPKLIHFLRDKKANPNAYSKEQTEEFLKPYKDTGVLEWLAKNKEVLEMMLRNISGSVPRQGPSVSAGRDSLERAVQPQQPGYPPTAGPPMGYPHAFVPKADKYRTVPCKYYHRL
jgi:hypothetical protein